jgi:hypothetical protein
MKERPWVFVFAPREGLDFSAAEKFGKVWTICQNTHPADIDGLAEEVRKNCSMFDPSEDYLLPTATITSSVVMALWVARVADLRYPDIKVLVYDAHSSDYRARKIKL